MPEEKHSIDHIDRGEGYICNGCYTKILLGEMYYRFRRMTGWYARHSDISVCDSKRKKPDSQSRQKEGDGNEMLDMQETLSEWTNYALQMPSYN